MKHAATQGPTAASLSGQSEQAAKSDRSRRISWFRDARFGMFIHWGLYSIPARGEWIRSTAKMRSEEYMEYFRSFDPDSFEPREWARLAKKAGMKYAVFTAKHHDGFCLFDSERSDFTSMKCPAHRDFVAEYLEAFRAEGLNAGLYFSIIDWHHPDFPHYGDRHHPMRDNQAFRGASHDFDRYLDFMHGQVRELCSNYGKIPLLWFDFSYGKMAGETWKATELVRMVRALQPEAVIDNRLEASGESLGSLRERLPAEFAGDFASPELLIPLGGFSNVDGESIPWEACVTMNNHWGYTASDTTWKSPRQLVRKLVECVAKDGNMILNVGPDPRGRIPSESVRILCEIGEWMSRNEASVRGCEPAGLPKPDWGWYTRRGDILYAHIFEAPIGPIHLPGLAGRRIARMRLVRDGTELLPAAAWNTSLFPGELFTSLAQPPEYTYPLPDETDTVIQIEMESSGGR